MRTLFKACVPVVLCLMTSGISRGETLTQTVRYHFAEHGTYFDGYNKLDPSLGTLNSVSLSFVGTSGSSVFLFTNTSGSAATYDAHVTFAIGTLVGSQGFSFDYLDILPSGGSIEHQLTRTYNLSTTITSPSGMLPWSGSGFYIGQDFFPTSNRGVATVDNSVIRISEIPSFFFDGIETVSYDFTPSTASTVPEPASVVIAGIGFVFVSWLSRRMRRRRKSPMIGG